MGGVSEGHFPYSSFRVSRQNLAFEEAKFACLKVVLSVFEKFSKFFLDFQWWKYTFYKKFSKNGLVSEKKISITGGRGGGAGPYMEFSKIIFYFFLNPSLILFYYDTSSPIFHLSLVN